MDEIKRRTILTIADFEFPYWLELGGREEELTREAVRLVNNSLNTYRSTFPNLTKEKYLALVAFDFCFKWLERKDGNDTKPFADKLEELGKTLEEFMREE